MSISRRALYAAGEPLGDSATRWEPGRLVCGGGGSSKSSTSSSTNYNVEDRRLVTGEGSVGISGNNSSIALYDYSQRVDPEIAKAAFAFAEKSDATNADGFSKLLGVAEGLFERGESLIAQTQDRVADAYAAAGSQVIDQAGRIDQKTMIVLAVVGVAAVAVLNRKG